MLAAPHRDVVARALTGVVATVLWVFHPLDDVEAPSDDVTVGPGPAVPWQLRRLQNLQNRRGLFAGCHLDALAIQ